MQPIDATDMFFSSNMTISWVEWDDTISPHLRRITVDQSHVGKSEFFQACELGLLCFPHHMWGTVMNQLGGIVPIV